MAERDGDENAETSMLMALRHLFIGYADRRMQLQPSGPSRADRRLAVYRDAIEAGITNRLDLQHLAGAAGVTRFQVIRDFKLITGLTPGTYIRNRRLRLACCLIEQGSGLSEAAAAAGFADQSHLTRAFKLSHGITPGMFRQACNISGQSG
jgi:AraC-like DNA-binding protein